jgi:hypothetical protein
MKTTVVYQAKATAAAYTAACDSVIGEQEFVELLLEEAEDEEGVYTESHNHQPNTRESAVVSKPLDQPATPTRVSEAIHRYFEESGPGHKALVSSIGELLKDKFGSDIANGWLGYSSISQLLRKLCNLQVERIDNRTVASREIIMDAEKGTE